MPNQPLHPTLVPRAGELRRWMESKMAHKRKDTLTKAVEWWKHLRPFNKRRVSKRERIAAEKEIKKEKEILNDAGK